MRKFSLLVLALTFISGLAMAQDPAKLIKTGAKALAAYKSDPSDTDALASAVQAGKEATQAGPDIAGAWMLLGNAHAAKVTQLAQSITRQNAEQAAAAVLDPSTPKPDFSTVEVPTEATENAIEAYKMAYSKSVKPKNKKKAVEGLQQLGSDMSVIGNTMLSAERYKEAYTPLRTMLTIDDIFVSNNEEPLFAEAENREQQKYITAIVARSAGDTENAMRLHKELYENETKEASIYAGYSTLLMDAGDEAKGLEVLTKGREMFPDNKDILFSEINYYIQKGDYATLETKLQAAIKQEPDNVGLYNALGNVYMNLSQDAEDEALAADYEEKSIGYYNEVIARDASNIDATYSIGSMYYNTAVKKAGIMNGLSTSKADQVKYDKLNEEIKVLFDKALPYFDKAIQLDPNDRNTLIALKEIYARKNDYAKSKEYGERLDNL